MLKAGLRSLLIVGLLALTSVGCVRQKPSQGSMSKLSDTTLDRHLTLTVTGERSFHFDGRAQLRFVVRLGTQEKAFASIASITVPSQLPNGPDGMVNPEVALTSVYAGDGSYNIPPGGLFSPRTGPTVPPATSKTGGAATVIQVSFIELRPTPREVRFDYRLKPCKVVLNDDGKQGSALCPSLANIDGKTVSLEMKWEA